MVFSGSSDGVRFEVGFEAGAGSVETERDGAGGCFLPTSRLVLMSFLNLSSSWFASRIMRDGRFLNSFDVFWNTFHPSDVTISRIHLPMVLPAFCISFGPSTISAMMTTNTSSDAPIPRISILCLLCPLKELFDLVLVVCEAAKLAIDKSRRRI